MNTEAPILFICASDTLVRLLMPIAQRLQETRSKVVFAKLQFTDECAEFELANHVPRSQYAGSVRHSEAWLSKYQAIVMGNDWGREIKALILQARRIGIPTICVQESVINFKDKANRMRFADHVLVQGAVSAKLLNERKNIHITGNPRYEHLTLKPRNATGDVLLNCNFTYGIEENNRHSWLSDAIAACNETKQAVTILQHPRDTADLAIYGKNAIRTNAATVHAQICNGATVVTRFSSVIHEAIALGRPVIYFNPYREDVGYDFGEQCAVLRYASNKDELKAALQDLAAHPPSPDDYLQYLAQHIRPTQKTPSSACAETILEIVEIEPKCTKKLTLSICRIALLSYCITEKYYLLLKGRL